MVTTRGAKRRRGLAAAALLLPCALAGCGGSQNALAPHSHPATDIANLFWVMMAVAFGGLALVTGLLVLAWFRRGRRGVTADTDPDDPHPGEKPSLFVVVGMGVVFPLAVVAALFIVSNGAIINVTQAPAASSTDLTVQAIGHQWYWEFRYPGTKAVTADELHIPVGTRVNLVAKTADVIHSFWVPELNRKIDTIPRQENRILLYANKPGVYRGQCAEYCGLQHAHMGMLVFAEPKAQFEAWLKRQSRPAATSGTPLEQRGRRVFENGPCASCHTIRGTTASGYVGPDLTHLASRTTLGGVTIPNRPDYLARWIVDSQHFKPGNEMPDLQLSHTQLRALVAYLGSLK
ncbi:MAG TPA: cytochrome c oxidase subunit II [Gaiellaceae bacterium]|nr:cytochrome c oxidase subunit II [Gaiellaceae bacterium]